MELGTEFLLQCAAVGHHAVGRFQGVAARDPDALGVHRLRFGDEARDVVGFELAFVGEGDVDVHPIPGDRTVEAVAVAEARHVDDHLFSFTAKVAADGEFAVPEVGSEGLEGQEGRPGPGLG